MSWQIVSQIVDVRFKSGYRLWDTAGELTTNLIENLPTFDVQEASPNKVVLLDKKHRVELTIALENCSIRGVMQACSPTNFYEVAEALFGKTLDHLRIQILTRIGHRIRYERRASSKENSFEHVHELATRLGQDRVLSGSDPRIVSKRVRDFSMRFDDEKSGFAMRVRPIVMNVEFDGAIPVELADRMPPPVHAVEFDIDIYTIGLVARKDFLPTEWIKANYRLVDSELLPRFK